MSMSDPIAAMLTIIRNGQMVNKTFVCTDMSKTKQSILDVLKDEGFILDYEVKDIENNIDSLEIKSAEQEIEEQTTLEESNNHTDSLKLNINNYISKKGCLIENKYFAFDSINSFLSNSGSYNGYTVQIYVSQETLKIRRVRKDFMINFPEQTLFDEYTAPNIFLYAGKFQDYNNAELFKKELEEVFKNTLIVRKQFPYKIEKK